MRDRYLSLKAIAVFLAKHRITFDGKAYNKKAKRFYVYLNNVESLLPLSAIKDLPSDENLEDEIPINGRLAVGYIEGNLGIGLVRFNYRFLRLFPLFEFIQMRRLAFSRNKGSDIELAFNTIQDEIMRICQQRSIDISSFLVKDPEPLVVRVNLRNVRKDLANAKKQQANEAVNQDSLDQPNSQRIDHSYNVRVMSFEPIPQDSTTPAGIALSGAKLTSNQLMATPEFMYDTNADQSQGFNDSSAQLFTISGSDLLIDRSHSLASAIPSQGHSLSSASLSQNSTVGCPRLHGTSMSGDYGLANGNSSSSDSTLELASAQGASPAATAPATHSSRSSGAATAGAAGVADITTAVSPSGAATTCASKPQILSNTLQRLSSHLPEMPQLQGIDPQVITAAALSTLSIIQLLKQSEQGVVAPEGMPLPELSSTVALPERAQTTTTTTSLGSSLADTLHTAPVPSPTNSNATTTAMAAWGAGVVTPSAHWPASPEIEVKILDLRLKDGSFPLPEYATPSSAGMDLRAMIPEDWVLHPQECKLIPTGIAIFIKNPYLCATVLPRSGLGFKHGIVLGNLTGLIDADYQGPLMVPLWNRSSEDFTIHVGDRIAQMVLLPIVRGSFKVVEEFAETERRTGGFGSTGGFGNKG